jgi:hypothetical protein
MFTHPLEVKTTPFTLMQSLSRYELVGRDLQDFTKVKAKITKQKN